MIVRHVPAFIGYLTISALAPAAAMAQGLTVAGHQIGLLQVQNTKPTGDFDLPFVDSKGELWFSRLQHVGVSETGRPARPRRDHPVAVPTVATPIPEGVPFASREPEPAGVQRVQRIADYQLSPKALLYLTACDSAPCSGGSLWSFDGLHRVKLHDGVLNAYFHPRLISVVIWTVEHEVLLVRAADASVIMRVPGHAAAPVFSHDGTLLAYEKLADSSPDGDRQSLFLEIGHLREAIQRTQMAP